MTDWADVRENEIRTADEERERYEKWKVEDAKRRSRLCTCVGSCKPESLTKGRRCAASTEEGA